MIATLGYQIPTENNLQSNLNNKQTGHLGLIWSEMFSGTVIDIHCVVYIRLNALITCIGDSISHVSWFAHNQRLFLLNLKWMNASKKINVRSTVCSSCEIAVN